MNLCVIPARGGSKRIPRKNIRLFAGKPMIAYAIEAAQESELFEHILVSTDDGEIADIAQHWGAEVPFKRPPELADDHTPTAPVIVHAIQNIVTSEIKMDFVCCIYPAVPMINSADIRDSFLMMKKANACSCIPVAQFHSSPQRCLKLDEGRVRFMYPEFSMKRTQDIEPAYFDIGQFYWGTVDKWMSGTVAGGIGFVIPNWRAIDIDDEDDWKRAEIFYTVYKKFS